MGRAPCCEKVGLKRGRWTAEEDEILTKYIKANGEGSWRSLPKNAGLFSIPLKIQLLILLLFFYFLYIMPFYFWVLKGCLDVEKVVD